MSNAMKETIVNSSYVAFYDIPYLANGGDLKTFDGKIYEIKGTVARDIETNEVIKLSSVYYSIRTVKNKKRQTVAKRKNRDDELKRVIYT